MTDGQSGDQGPEDFEPGTRMPRDADGNEPPWWHAVPPQPPVDSVAVEGLKLLGALRDWAVDSGAVAAASGLAQNAAATASAYLAQAAEAHPAPEPEAEVEVEVEPTEPPQQVVRCSDCPVCQGLDALERANPELAHTARAALTQVSALLNGWLGADPGEE